MASTISCSIVKPTVAVRAPVAFKPAKAGKAAAVAPVTRPASFQVWQPTNNKVSKRTLCP